MNTHAPVKDTWLSQLDARVPRYTSYPTAPHFHKGVTAATVNSWLERTDMSEPLSLYLHIPFCKQACHYCDFHFSTSMKKKKEMMAMMAREIALRSDWFSGSTPTLIETIYFGGGTPSVLDSADLNFLLDTIDKHFKVGSSPEITVEANPDDLTSDYLKALSRTPVNRLSIGVQSFFEEDLRLMNRAHNATQALASVQMATDFFDSISLDLIYGIPGLTDEKWMQNINTALQLGVSHISSYALTVESKTALAHFVKKGIIPKPDDAQAQAQFLMIIDQLEAHDLDRKSVV
mgnify:CR=1 FL=1